MMSSPPGPVSELGIGDHAINRYPRLGTIRQPLGLSDQQRSSLVRETIPGVQEPRQNTLSEPV